MAERTKRNKVNTLTYSECINTYNGGIKNGMLQVVLGEAVVAHAAARTGAVGMAGIG